MIVEGLPPIPRRSLSQLRRNRWLTVAEAGSGQEVGLGERIRNLAATWGIALPPPGNGID